MRNDEEVMVSLCHQMVLPDELDQMKVWKRSPRPATSLFVHLLQRLVNLGRRKTGKSWLKKVEETLDYLHRRHVQTNRCSYIFPNSKAPYPAWQENWNCCSQRADGRIANCYWTDPLLGRAGPRIHQDLRSYSYSSM